MIKAAWYNIGTLKKLLQSKNFSKMFQLTALSTVRKR